MVLVIHLGSWLGWRGNKNPVHSGEAFCTKPGLVGELHSTHYGPDFFQGGEPMKWISKLV